jgi:hypothetical protein
MPSDMNSLAFARQRWPKNTNSLAAPVRAVFNAWDRCRETDQDDALELIDGFTRPSGRSTAKQKCRDLTLMRSPLPSSAPNVSPLSGEEVAVFFEGAPPRD